MTKKINFMIVFLSNRYFTTEHVKIAKNLDLYKFFVRISRLFPKLLKF